MFESIENQVKKLRALFWSEKDQEGQGFVALAESYRKAGDLDQSMELLEEGLARIPNHASGLVVLAWVQRDRGDLDAARETFEKVALLDPENTAAQMGLGDMAVLDGFIDRARSHYLRCLELDPGDEEASARLATLPDSDEEGDASGVGEAGADPISGADGEFADHPDQDATFPADDPGDTHGPADAEEDPSPVHDFSPAEDFAPTEDLAPTETVEDGESPDVPAGDSVAGPPAEEGTGDVYTRTMAEVYANQGLYLRAVDVYERILQASPGDAAAEARVAELRALAGVGDDTIGETPSGDAWNVSDTMAAHLAEHPDGHEVTTPFAWSGDTGDSEPLDGDHAGPTVGEYFADLLAWEPQDSDEEAVAEVDELSGGLEAVPEEWTPASESIPDASVPDDSVPDAFDEPEDSFQTAEEAEQEEATVPDPESAWDAPTGDADSLAAESVEFAEFEVVEDIEFLDPGVDETFDGSGAGEEFAALEADVDLVEPELADPLEGAQYGDVEPAAADADLLEADPADATPDAMELDAVVVDEVVPLEDPMQAAGAEPWADLPLVPVDDLAPDPSPVEEEPVPIEDLAPAASTTDTEVEPEVAEDEPLADPEGFEAVEAADPVVEPVADPWAHLPLVPVASLAPEDDTIAEATDAPDSDGQDDPDAFDSWLKGLKS